VVEGIMMGSLDIGRRRQEGAVTVLF